jgi:hypothetical protein
MMISHHFKATTLRLIIQLINTVLGIYFSLILMHFFDLHNKNGGYYIPVEFIISISIIVSFILFVAEPIHKVNYFDFVPKLDKEYQENFISKHIQVLFVFLIVSILIAVSSISNHSFSLSDFLSYLALISIFFILYVKYAVYKMNKLLLAKILITPKLKLKTKYYDYINKNIVDDEPHLELNQLFTFQVKEHFRNSKEEKEITILNPKTPNKPAEVLMLESKYLADYVREGNKLKAKLIKILPNTELLIEIEREENYDDRVYERQLNY